MARRTKFWTAVAIASGLVAIPWVASFAEEQAPPVTEKQSNSEPETTNLQNVRLLRRWQITPRRVWRIWPVSKTRTVVGGKVAAGGPAAMVVLKERM